MVNLAENAMLHWINTNFSRSNRSLALKEVIDSRSCCFLPSVRHCWSSHYFFYLIINGKTFIHNMKGTNWWQTLGLRPLWWSWSCSFVYENTPVCWSTVWLPLVSRRCSCGRFLRFTTNCWKSSPSERWPGLSGRCWAACPPLCTLTAPWRPSNCSALPKRWNASFTLTQVDIYIYVYVQILQ